MGKKTFITFFLNVLKNIQLKPKKPKKTQHPKWDFKLILGFLGFLGLNPPPPPPSMNLSADEEKMIMTACTEIKYGMMQSAIKRILGGNSNVSSNEIKIKQETQDMFYSRGNNNNNQGYKQGNKSNYGKNLKISRIFQVVQMVISSKIRARSITKIGLETQCCA